MAKRQIEAGTGIIVPSNPADRLKLKNQLTEGTYCLTRAAAERETLKEIVAAIEEDFEIPKKVVSRLIKTMYKRDFAKEVAEHEDFEALYETVVEGSTGNKDEDKE